MKRKIYFPLFSLLFSFLTPALFSISAYSQESSKDAEIVITATRHDSSIIKEGKSITVITDEDIKNSGKQTLTDLLETVPGLTVTRAGTDGGLINVYIRGGKRGNVLFMIDGIRLSDPMGIQKGCDISGIMSAGIERIEIVRGAMSSLYGAEASGGIINIITKKGNARELVITGEGGSNKSFRGTVTASDVTDRSTFFFMGSHFESHGISKASKNLAIDSFDDDGYSNTSAAGRMTSAISDTARVNFTMNYTNSTSDLDDGALEDDPNHESTGKLFTGRGEFAHSPFSWFNYRVGLSYMSYVRSDVDAADFIDTTENDSYWYNGSNMNADFIMDFTIMRFNTLIVGGELLNEKGSSTASYFDEWGGNEFKSDIFKEKHALTKSLFIHDRLSVAEVFFLNGGLRLDYHDTFGAFYTWDAASSVIIPFTGTRLRASMGTGFRAPSLYELYSAYGSEDLDPEKSLVYDAGLSQNFFSGLVFIDCGIFWQEYKNLIDFGAGSKYDNVNGTVKNSGLEASMIFKPAAFISLTYGYTYIKYRGDENSRAALKRPKHKHFASALLLPFERLSLMLTYVYAGKRQDVYYNSDTYISETKDLGSYHKVDINIRYEAMKNLVLTVRCENLTDSDYKETYGYDTHERSFYGGVQAAF